MPPTDPSYENNHVHRRVRRQQFERGKLSRTAELRTRRGAQSESLAKTAHPVAGEASPQLGLHDVVCGSRHTLLLTGALDIASCHVLNAALLELSVDWPTMVVLDLSKLTFMDSSGMDAVLAAKQLCDEHMCDFRVIPGDTPVLRIFAVTGLLDLLPLATDESRAHTGESMPSPQRFSPSPRGL